MWECGLKLNPIPSVRTGRSHSLCGSVDWNLMFEMPARDLTVTPYVGVWIETLAGYHLSKNMPCHSLCGSVDWNIETTAGFEAAVSHSLCGSVDWNRSNGQRVWESPWSLLMWECGLKQSSWRKWCRLWRHSLCGSVDWNSRLTMNWNHKEVTPYVGVWIETQRTVSCGYPKKVTPYVGVWIETEETKKAGETAAVTPYVGVWIETQPYMSL